MKNTGVMDYYKKSSIAASRIGHRARARVQELRGVKMRATLSFVLISQRDTQSQSVFF